MLQALQVASESLPFDDRVALSRTCCALRNCVDLDAEINRARNMQGAAATGSVLLIRAVRKRFGAHDGTEAMLAAALSEHDSVAVCRELQPHVFATSEALRAACFAGHLRTAICLGATQAPWDETNRTLVQWLIGAMNMRGDFADILAAITARNSRIPDRDFSDIETVITGQAGIPPRTFDALECACFMRKPAVAAAIAHEIRMCDTLQCTVLLARMTVIDPRFRAALRALLVDRETARAAIRQLCITVNAKAVAEVWNLAPRLYPTVLRTCITVPCFDAHAIDWRNQVITRAFVEDIRIDEEYTICFDDTVATAPLNACTIEGCERSSMPGSLRCEFHQQQTRAYCFVCGRQICVFVPVVPYDLPRGHVTAFMLHRDAGGIFRGSCKHRISATGVVRVNVADFESTVMLKE